MILLLISAVVGIAAAYIQREPRPFADRSRLGLALMAVLSTAVDAFIMVRLVEMRGVTTGTWCLLGTSLLATGALFLFFARIDLIVTASHPDDGLQTVRPSVRQRRDSEIEAPSRLSLLYVAPLAALCLSSVLGLHHAGVLWDMDRPSFRTIEAVAPGVLAAPFSYRSIRIGDCIDETGLPEVDNARTVPCALEHTWQVFDRVSEDEDCPLSRDIESPHRLLVESIDDEPWRWCLTAPEDGSQVVGSVTIAGLAPTT